MSDAPAAGVVVDTMVISWLFADQPHPPDDRYRELIGRRPVLLTFQTVMELRYGALRAGWAELRRRRLERDIAQLTVVQADDELATVCARLRDQCQRTGHALGNKVHDGVGVVMRKDPTMRRSGRLATETLTVSSSQSGLVPRWRTTVAAATAAVKTTTAAVGRRTRGRRSSRVEPALPDEPPG
jgi:predicted nucleic acid-binding protein